MSQEKSRERTLADLKQLFQEVCSMPEDVITPDSSLTHDLRLDGEEAADLLEAYATRFGVSLESFEFFKYFGPEGTNLIGMIRELITRENCNSKPRLTVNDLIKGIKDGHLE